jgi:hypothetical protein
MVLTREMVRDAQAGLSTVHGAGAIDVLAVSLASEFAARAALSSWLAESSSSWKGGEISMQALAAISSWSSEIMAAQGFAASSWSASQN